MDIFCCYDIIVLLDDHFIMINICSNMFLLLPVRYMFNVCVWMFQERRVLSSID